MSAYRPTIGLEIHAELNTRTKMFCACQNDPEAEAPNTNVCPICMAHPGTLPVANREAVHQVLRVGTALGSKLADFTEWDRKSYFYPDIPKGYQISQYEHPLVEGGSLAGVAITRVHAIAPIERGCAPRRAQGSGRPGPRSSGLYKPESGMRGSAQAPAVRVCPEDDPSGISTGRLGPV